MLRPDTFALTALLALLTAIGPLSVDLYLPSLPEIGRVLGATTAEVQLTISSYLIGFAGGQIVYGPVSDIYGRKRILLVALVIFCAATLACAFAPGIDMLIAARAIQAAGASGAVVLARAVVRDLYSGARAGREMSLMGMIMGIAPVVAPVIGGVLQAVFGWRACFLFVCAAGLVAIGVVWRLLPETLRDRPRGSFTLSELLRAYRLVARNRGFLLAAAATTAFVPSSAAGLVAPMMLYLAGLGLAMPQALAGALQPFPDHAGTASSLVGFVQQTAAAVAGAVVGHLLTTTAWPLVLIVTASGCLMLIVWILTRGIRAASLRRS